MHVHVNRFVSSIRRVYPQQGRYSRFRHDMNENPDGLPKEFVNSVIAEISPAFLATYPEPGVFLNKYAALIGVDFENVTCTNGSDQAIRYLMETFGEVGKEVVAVSPSFEMYRVNAMLLGYKYVPVDYEPDMTMRIDKIIASITDDTRIVVLLNPNNPVGNVYTEDEFLLVQKRAEEVGALVIVDEAYHYFYPNTFLTHALSVSNVVVLRTFSKLMSIAACRLGVIIANKELIRCVNNFRLTFDVNSIALLFATRLIEHKEIISALITVQQEGKDWILSALRKHNYWCRDCYGNFILVKPNNDAHTVAAVLEKEYNVLVHSYVHRMLRGILRLSTGSKSSMERLLDAFICADNGGKL